MKANSKFWVIGLGQKFFCVAPYRTMLVLAASLVSQASLLLAFLLPLKIVMLLGSESVPDYMPPPLVSMGINTLIIALSGLALFFYITHLLANRITEKASRSGSEKLIKASQKIILFENQDTIAFAAYKRYVEALSGLTFSTLALLVLAPTYQGVALTTLIFLVGAIGIAKVVTTLKPRTHQTLIEKAPSYANAITATGFLAVFVFIVIDFIALTPPNFLIAIIAIILSRQLMTQTALVLRNMAFLVQQKQKITALFFHDTQLDEQPHTADASVWHLLEDNTLASWIDYLKERLRPNTLDSDYDTNWVQTNVPNVMGIEVHWRLFGFSILIKVFEKNRTASATHETTLLLDRPNNIPAPPLLLAEKKDGFSYLVFDITGYRPAHLIPHLKAQKEITKQLLFTEPSPDMEKRYRRSRKMLWEKLDRSFFSRLNLIADDKQQSDLTTLRSNLTRVQETLRKHALQIHTSIPSPPGSGLFYRSHDERLVLAHWAHWKAEPQGSGWPVKSATDLEDLGELIKAGYTATNSKNVEATVTSCKIAACTNAMIREYEQQRYQSSFVFLRLLIELI